MPDEGISHSEVVEALRKSEKTTRLNSEKFKFLYRDLEVVAQRKPGYWLIVTCYRLK